MSGAAGYILVLSEARAEVFEDQSTVGPFFAEAVEEFAHSRSTALICFISAEPGRITHIAQGKRGQSAGTGQRRLNLTDIRTLSRSIATEHIAERVGANVRKHVSLRLSKGGLLPPKSFEDTIAAFMELAPDLRDVLHRYSESRRESIGRLSDRARAALGAQKEAVNTALHLADIDRTPLLEWTPERDAQSQSFLEGLPQSRLMEDQMIWHDLLEPLPGFHEVKRSITGIAKFENREIELEVIVANRTPLEKQTGADLIYFNATFKSFVLVQYKAMERKDSRGEAIFRLPNAKLTEEIARMDKILDSLKGVADPAHRHDYRLNRNPFFLKLCPRIVFDPDNVGLTPGIYLPLDYWRFVEQDTDLVGKRGGRVVTYENVGRYLDNTDFAAIVRGAWIGTTPQQTALLAQVVEALLTNGRAVLIAVKSDKPIPRRRDREDELDEDEDHEAA